MARGGHTGNHVAEAFTGNDEHVELSGLHKPTSETSTQGMATISSPETTSDTNTQGLATISSPEPTEQGNLQNPNLHYVVNLYVMNELVAVFLDRDAGHLIRNGF